MRLGSRMAMMLGVATVVMLGAASVASAQRLDANVFKIEWKKRTDPHLRPGLEGWVLNTSNYRVGSMLLKVQTLDSGSRVVTENNVWVYGHVPPFGGRAFFVVPLPPSDTATYRILIDSYDVIALDGG